MRFLYSKNIIARIAAFVTDSQQSSGLKATVFRYLRRHGTGFAFETILFIFIVTGAVWQLFSCLASVKLCICNSSCELWCIDVQTAGTIEISLSDGKYIYFVNTISGIKKILRLSIQLRENRIVKLSILFKLLFFFLLWLSHHPVYYFLKQSV